MNNWGWLFLIFVIGALLWQINQTDTNQLTQNNNVNTVLSESLDQGFAKADRIRTFSFPHDHYMHPKYRIEWWYITGNLQSDTGRAFGYQITFFRTALTSKSQKRQSSWASNHIWMAHLAVSDIEQQQHIHTQKISRGAAGLAGISQQPFKIWLDDWQITANSSGNFPWAIIAKDQKINIDVTINPLKPIVLQGDQGLSQKSSEPGNASYYYSSTRMQTSGTITINNTLHQVKGLSWLDREWSTSALGKHQSGWDWFSLQLNTGEELMFYRIRDKAGNSDKHSQGKWIDDSGNSTALDSSDVILEALDYWQPSTGKSYPISWRMTLPKRNKEMIIKAAINDQLMRTTFEYWEGAVNVYNTGLNSLAGKGYLEMTGY